MIPQHVLPVGAANMAQFDAALEESVKTEASNIDLRKYDFEQEKAPVVAKLELSKVQLAEIIEAQVTKQLKRFKDAYNKNHPDSFIDLVAGLETYHLEDGAGKSIALLRITLVKDAVPGIVYQTKYSFSHPEQLKNTGEWKLTMWNEALYHLIGGGLSYALLIRETNKETTP